MKYRNIGWLLCFIGIMLMYPVAFGAANIISVPVGNTVGLIGVSFIVIGIGVYREAKFNKKVWS